MQYYVAKNNQQMGPYTLYELNNHLASGYFTPNDLGWKEGMANWTPLNQMLDLPAPPIVPGAPSINAPYIANPNPYASAGGYQAGMAGAYMAPVERMGFWIRFAAFVIDWLVVAFAALVIGVIIGVVYYFTGGRAGDDLSQNPLLNLLGVCIMWLYYALMESSPLQATLGKLALGMKVTDLDGNRIGFARATGRHFAKFLSGVLLGAGFVAIGVSPEKRGWHDQLAGTQVIRR